MLCTATKHRNTAHKIDVKVYFLMFPNIYIQEDSIERQTNALNFKLRSMAAAASIQEQILSKYVKNRRYHRLSTIINSLPFQTFLLSGHFVIVMFLWSELLEISGRISKGTFSLSARLGASS